MPESSGEDSDDGASNADNSVAAGSDDDVAAGRLASGVQNEVNEVITVVHQSISLHYCVLL